MQSSKTWFNYLNDSAEFRAAVRARWNQLDQGLHMNAFIAEQKALLGKSAAENYVKWNHGSRISEYQVIKGSLGQRRRVPPQLDGEPQPVDRQPARQRRLRFRRTKPI